MPKEKNEKRFERIYNQGVISTMEIWVDKVTGVNYVCYVNGYAGE